MRMHPGFIANLATPLAVGRPGTVDSFVAPSKPIFRPPVAS